MISYPGGGAARLNSKERCEKMQELLQAQREGKLSKSCYEVRTGYDKKNGEKLDGKPHLYPEKLLLQK